MHNATKGSGSPQQITYLNNVGAIEHKYVQSMHYTTNLCSNLTAHDQGLYNHPLDNKFTRR